MEKKRFIYITPFIEEDFFTVVKNGIRDAAEMLQVDVEFTGTTDADVTKLTDMVGKAVDEGYDGIAISLVDQQGLKPAVERAVHAGVPIVAFNIGNTEDVPVLASVCQDAYQAGNVVGARIKEALPAGAKILYTLHDDVEVLRARLKGIQDIMGTDHAKVIVAGNAPDLAAENIGKELKADPDICAVIGTGQSDTNGAGLAAKELGDTRKIYTAGFDVCQDILNMVKEGVISFTIDQQPYVQGFYPLLMLYQNASYGIMPSDINAGAAVIHAGNIDQVLEAAKQGVR